MIRVLHLRSSNGVYGAEQVVLNLASKKSSADISTRVAIFGDQNGTGADFYNLCRHRGIDVVLLGRGKRLSFSALRSIGDFIASCRTPIVLHSHDVKSNLHAVIAGKKHGVPVVITQHGRTSDTVAMRVYETIDRRVSRFATAVVQVSENSRVSGSGGGSGVRHLVIENGVDTEKLDGCVAPDDVAKLLTRRGLVISNFSRFTEEKDHKTLLRAFRIATDQGLEGELLLAGDGLLLDQIQQQSESLQLSNRVHFLGFRNDVPALLKLSDIYVSSSRTEGLPMVVLEAMAARVPIIATSVGALPGVLSQNCGLLTAPGDPAALAENIISLANNRDLRLSMAQLANDRVVRQYGVQQQMRQYAELYGQILNVRDE